jgi:antitoxin component of MazEF toxin-antitoxin module
MTYPLKVQAIRSQGQQPRLYVSFPQALAAAIGLNPGDQVQWELLDRSELHLVRLETPPPAAKRQARKNLPDTPL